MKKAFTRFTLVVFVFAIIGLSAQTSFAGRAQIVIVNINAPNVGFNDPTPRAPVGGNSGTTLGQQRLIAFQRAAEIWAARLDSNIPIRIRAQFIVLGAGVLGQLPGHFKLAPRPLDQPFQIPMFPPTLSRPLTRSKSMEPQPMDVRHSRTRPPSQAKSH